MMANKLMLCVLFVSTITVAVCKDTCWGQTSIEDIKILFPYCKDIIGSNSVLEDEVTDFDVERSPEEICPNIKKLLNNGSIDFLTISKFNKCMSLKIKGLGFYQVKKVTDCISTLRDPVLMEELKGIVYNHIVDRKIYKSSMEYLNERRTVLNKYAMEEFFDCIGYHPDTWFQYHN